MALLAAAFPCVHGGVPLLTRMAFTLCEHSQPSTLVCTGEPVKLALLGGSLSMRGWNHADESYMAQVHKWLELAMVEGCR